MINRRLYDIILRQQVFLEGFKNYQIAQFRKELPALLKALKVEFAKVPYKTLDEMTKRELNEFQRNIKIANNKFFDFWNKRLLSDLNDFIEVELNLTKQILGNSIADEKKIIYNEETITKIIEDNMRKEDSNKILPFAWVLGDSLEQIKQKIANSIIPATGTLPSDFMDGLGVLALTRIASTINKGFADRQTISEIYTNITGTKENNYKDGLLIAIDRAQITIANTLIQQNAAIIAAAVFGTVYDKYIWLSVMDSRTTVICISRNKRVYVYGKGPLPPAHPRCRSRISPFFGQETPEETGQVWASKQPEPIKEYIKDNFKPLTLDQYGNKLSMILTR